GEGRGIEKIDRQIHLGNHDGQDEHEKVASVDEENRGVTGINEPGEPANHNQPIEIDSKVDDSSDDPRTDNTLYSHWLIEVKKQRHEGDMAFPWSTFGYSLTSFPFSLQFADLVGIYGVSFVLVLLNVLLFHSLKDRRYIVAWLLIVAALNAYNTFRWFRGIGTTVGSIEVA